MGPVLAVPCLLLFFCLKASGTFNGMYLCMRLNNAWLVVTSRKVSTCIGYILAYQQLWVIPGAYGGSYAPGNTPEGGMSHHQGTLWAHRYDLFVVYREEH